MITFDENNLVFITKGSLSKIFVFGPDAETRKAFWAKNKDDFLRQANAKNNKYLIVYVKEPDHFPTKGESKKQVAKVSSQISISQFLAKTKKEFKSKHTN